MKQNKELEHIEIWKELSNIASKGYSTVVVPDKDKKDKRKFMKIHTTALDLLANKSGVHPEMLPSDFQHNHLYCYIETKHHLMLCLLPSLFYIRLFQFGFVCHPPIYQNQLCMTKYFLFF